MAFLTALIILSLAWQFESVVAQTRPASQPALHWTETENAWGEQIRCLVTVLLHHYELDHNGRLPHFVGDAVPGYLADTHPVLESNQIQTLFIAPSDRDTLTLPDALTPEWVEAHLRYIYLGDNVDLTGMSGDDRSEIVLLHTSLTEPIHHATGVPIVIVCNVDGIAEMMSPEQAQKRIAESKKRLDAVRAREH